MASAEARLRYLRNRLAEQSLLDVHTVALYYDLGHQFLDNGDFQQSISSFTKVGSKEEEEEEEEEEKKSKKKIDDRGDDDKQEERRRKAQGETA